MGNDNLSLFDKIEKYALCGVLPLYGFLWKDVNGSKI
jgi:hypothetical protein